MIKKIKKINKLGIFKDYSWNNELKEFSRYNLIYGWTGSGKTTLTHFFAAIEEGASKKYQDLEYEIEIESGSIKQGETFSKKVRVFNEDFISENVSFLQGEAKSINIILGKENKKVVDELEIDVPLLDKKKAEHKEVAIEIVRLNNQKDKTFSDIASTISFNTSGTTSRTYRKPNAEDAFQQLSAKALLEEPEIENHKQTLQQTEVPPVPELTVSKLKYLEGEEELELGDFLDKVIVEGKNLCAQTVESITIERLIQNDDISQWVEEGIALHEKHKSKICEYCNQFIPNERKVELVNHFNEADKKLKDSIDDLVEVSRKAYTLIEGIKPVDKANLYKEIHTEYQSSTQTYEDAKQNILEKIVELGKSLKEKKYKTTECVKLEINIDINPFITAVENVNSKIKKCNTKTDDFKNEKKTAREKLEKHYLSTIYDEVIDSETKIKVYGNKKEILGIEISKLGRKIAENKAKISSSHKAGRIITEHLRTFLGRDEIVFESEEEGYLIKRNGEIAYNLSEGEKNAIAFVYFVVHLQDDFDIKEGIVVVDDPVSSLDSNSLYQAFAFLKNAVKDAHQVFLFTHNFDFLRLLLNWLNYGAYTNCRSYYMLNNHYIERDRSVEITELDKLLENHESEYHYLFKKLYEFRSDGSIESVYHVPNLARKLLDTFLMFRVPNNKNNYEKLSVLDFDENKKTAIYKFTNDLSHMTGKGFDPSLVQETQKNVEYLLAMMEDVFIEHYKILVESINN